VVVLNKIDLIDPESQTELEKKLKEVRKEGGREGRNTGFSISRHHLNTY